MSKVFCVEDDINIRELIEYTMSSVGFDTESFENGEDFFKRLQSAKPDVLLLDIMLPDMDGMEILKRVRENVSTKDICVILITAKSERMDKIRGLDMGADDYITKPFDVLELISRVKAHLRRCNLQENSAKKAENISLDLNKRLVFVRGEEVSLTYKEFELLNMLLEAKGNVVARESIIRRIWGSDFEGETRTLDVHMRTLRQKLGEEGSVIETVRNVGYRID